jgi:hypothetical protein
MVQIFALPLLAAIISLLGIFFAKIRKSDPHQYEINRRSFPRPTDTLTGQAKIGRDSRLPDGSVHRGIVYNAADKQLELQGALSQEAINRIIV